MKGLPDLPPSRTLTTLVTSRSDWCLSGQIPTITSAFWLVWAESDVFFISGTPSYPPRFVCVAVQTITPCFFARPFSSAIHAPTWSYVVVFLPPRGRVFDAHSFR